MNRILRLSLLLMLACGLSLRAQEFNDIPTAWKWTGDDTVLFSYDGSFADGRAFLLHAFSRNREQDLTLPPVQEPIRFEGAKNPTFSPDSSRVAFTLDGDLYVSEVESGRLIRVTTDGSALVQNGYASWVYYEEIFGRKSQYRAFWWSPDSRKLAFYRFDDSAVPEFPIWSPFGTYGSLRLTRYPKAGEPNPKVRIAVVDLSSAKVKKGVVRASDLVWADFDDSGDPCYGTPFWGADSRHLYVSREPRTQNLLELYRVSVSDGKKTRIYREESTTWVNWPDGLLFGKDGLYMARADDSGWQQIYYLSYDGSTLKRLSEGPNWRVELLRLGADGSVFFSAERDSHVRSALYRLEPDGTLHTLTDPDFHVQDVRFSPSGKWFVTALSNGRTPTRIWLCETETAELAWYAQRATRVKQPGVRLDTRMAGRMFLVSDAAGPAFRSDALPLPEIIELSLPGGLKVPGALTLPEGFDPARRYPVHLEIYGGPNTAYVRDRWRKPSEMARWFAQNGIIHLTADVRASGHNGKAGLDGIFRDLTTQPIEDFVAWAEYLKGLPYVDGARIGVEGFSFGGTNTALLLLCHSDLYCCGIAGGGVYDWRLYDSHYTERFMRTPAENPEGYAACRVLDRVGDYPADGRAVLRLTHGTGDDNVHLQNTLLLADALQKAGKPFELMLYPDGMHGYRGYQGEHSRAADREFWRKHLIEKQ
ncbi:MAG: DPP IV N-terminal domain-containing protein [Bacteroidales bacterium]|nr:DPP IV N-terminal domain-containing protein [Bacteroidales bacterium]